MEVAALKNLFFLAVGKLDMKDSFRYKKEMESMGKTFPIISAYINIAKHYLACTWKWKCQGYVVVLHGLYLLNLNFTVAFLLIRKTWDDWFAGKLGGWWILRNEWGS